MYFLFLYVCFINLLSLFENLLWLKKIQLRLNNLLYQLKILLFFADENMNILFVYDSTDCSHRSLSENTVIRNENA